MLSRFFSILLLSCFVVVESMAADATADELRSGLPKAANASDSLTILFDVFDASPQDKKNAVGWQILDIASRVNDQDVLMEFLPQVAMLNLRSDEKLRDLLVIAEKIEDAQQRKGVKTFININRAVNEASFLTESERQHALLKYAKTNISAKDTDLYDEILNLGRVLVFIGVESKSNMYLEYLARFEKLVEQLPEDSYYIRNLYYTTAVNAHTFNGNYEKALETDRKLLKVIKGLEDKYREKGRKYRSYDRFYYLCYRRMLRNYRGLTFEEVQDLYSKCAMLADRDEEIHEDFYVKGRPTVYRLMAGREYKQAVPRIKNALLYVSDRNGRRDLLRMLVQASDSVGDDATLLKALKDYNAVLQESLLRRSEESYREMQIRYDVNQLKSENIRLEGEKKDTEIITGQKLVSIVLAALLVLALIVMFLYRSHFSLKQKNRDLKKENDRLHDYVKELLNGGVPEGSKDLRK